MSSLPAAASRVPGARAAAPMESSGATAMDASPDRPRSTWRADPGPGGPLPRLLPAAMLVAATCLCAGTADLFTPELPLGAYLAIAGAGLLYRWWWEVRGVHSGAGAVLGFVGHSLACVGLVMLNPLYGFYAFVGYFDAVRIFTGPALWLAIAAVASATGLSQSGGTTGAWASPPMFVLIVVVNVALSGTMIMVEKRREEAVTRREEAVRRLEAALAENAALQAQLVGQARESGVLEERARLSREIHDTVAQGLVGVITQLGAIESAGAADRVRIERAGRAARDSLAEARRAVAALASPHLDDADLPTALSRLVRRWGEAAGIEGRLVLDGPPRESAHDADLLRIAQEALANVARHSGARRTTVTLTYVADEVRLDVRDDGHGFDPDAPAAGRGLPGMRERLRAAGGALVVESRPGEGCVVSAAVPT
ncbi:sensor histidine kinase [Agilicoccus flavus]|uniref:sensor histidine kinase n=1 Tax=Agilicoccus flavus TaxID=2775968 RepID=UPI001CF6A43D|nr:sensor histidine kinase [Agilicoccus flavus]